MPMRRSTDRILVSHAGTLPRPDDVARLFNDGPTTSSKTAARRGQGRRAPAGRSGHRHRQRRRVQQTRRLLGLRPQSSERHRAAHVRARRGPAGARRHRARPARFPGRLRRRRRPVPRRRDSPTQPFFCTEPLKYVGQANVQNDIANLKAAAAGLDVEPYLPAIAPGTVEHWLWNEHYPNDEAFLFAIADALHEEYKAITDAGLMLQIDDPDLPDGWQMYPGHERRRLSRVRRPARRGDQPRARRAFREDRVRLHICWGSGHGPHKNDIPLARHRRHRAQSQGGVLLRRSGQSAPRVRVARLAADVKLPDGKSLMPGVVGHASNVIEHPETVADRLVRYASLVGRENVIAGHRLRHRHARRPRRDRLGQTASPWSTARASRPGSCGAARRSRPGRAWRRRVPNAAAWPNARTPGARGGAGGRTCPSASGAPCARTTRADGDAWDYFPHDHARSRAYRWGEDGLLGICDNRGRLCFALALWNERRPDPQGAPVRPDRARRQPRRGRQGVYFYLDSTPTHAYMRALYKYPQRAFPYDDLVAGEPPPRQGPARVRAARYRRLRREPLLRRRGRVRQGRPDRPGHSRQRHQPRPGAGPPAPAADALVSQHLVLGQRRPSPDPLLRQVGPGVDRSRATPTLGTYWLACQDAPDAAVHRERDQRRAAVGRAQSHAVRQRRHPRRPSSTAQRARRTRRRWAPRPRPTTPDASRRARRRPCCCGCRTRSRATPLARRRTRPRRCAAPKPTSSTPARSSAPSVCPRTSAASSARPSPACCGASSSTTTKSRTGSTAIRPARRRRASRKHGRNADWRHLHNMDVISMPDKWEYPWYAAWDLAFPLHPAGAWSIPTSPSAS